MAFILASSLVSLPVSVLLLCRPFVRGSEFEFVTGSSRGYLDPTSRYAQNLSVVSEHGFDVVFFYIWLPYLSFPYVWLPWIYQHRMFVFFFVCFTVLLPYMCQLSRIMTRILILNTYCGTIRRVVFVL